MSDSNAEYLSDDFGGGGQNVKNFNGYKYSVRNIKSINMIIVYILPSCQLPWEPFLKANTIQQPAETGRKFKANTVQRPVDTGRKFKANTVQQPIETGCILNANIVQQPVETGRKLSGEVGSQRRRLLRSRPLKY